MQCNSVSQNKILSSSTCSFKEKKVIISYLTLQLLIITKTYVRIQVQNNINQYFHVLVLLCWAAASHMLLHSASTFSTIKLLWITFSSSVLECFFLLPVITNMKVNRSANADLKLPSSTQLRDTHLSPSIFFSKFFFSLPSNENGKVS